MKTSHSMTFKRFLRGVIVVSFLWGTACSNKPEPPTTALRPSPTLTRHVSFVQWTDPHVFDAGKGRHAEGVREEEIDNWAAFHWAVLETNQRVLAEHRTIDFVVITGDFGLENVQLSDAKGSRTDGPDCANRKASDEGPIDRVRLAVAASETARELNALLVKRVYLVPGNNDLCAEDPRDIHRWTEFVSALQKELARQHETTEASLKQSVQDASKKIEVPPSVQIEDLTALKDPPVINGITLLGLDSAFFKSHDNKGEEAIKAAANTAIGEEIGRVRKQIQPGGSYLLFTHIPNLKDPYLGDSKDYKESWGLPPKALDDWQKQILNKSEILGIFAGHFHIAKRELYPHNFGYSKPDANTTAKLWLAPPLAEKYQWQSPSEETARGMLLVSVNADGDARVSSDDDGKVKASAIWFSTLDQKATTVGDDRLAEARAAERDGQWDDAANKYHEALGLSGADSRTRATALSGYVHARERMHSWWWQNPLARWFYLKGIRLLITLAIVLGAVFVYAILRGFYVIKGATILLKFVAVPDFEGRVTINETVSMTDNAPVKLFAALLRAEGEEIRRRLRQEQESWAAGHITLLAPSGTSLDSLVTSIPKVGSVDVSGWAKFLLNLLQLFRWTVQTGLAVFPPDAFPAPAAAAATVGSDVIVAGAELNAYAVLQWAWITRNSWWRMRKVEDDRSAIRELARELAELISGEAFV
jgi:hypothetical protein